MTEYDTDSGATADSELKDAAETAERILGRNLFVAKIVAGFAVAIGASLVIRWLASGTNTNALASILVWFSIIFAVMTLALATVVKIIDVIQRHRSDRW